MDRYQINLAFNEEPLIDAIPIWCVKVAPPIRNEDKKFAILNSIAKALRLFVHNVEGFTESKRLIAERHQDKIVVIPEPSVESDLRKGLKVKAHGKWFSLYWGGEDKLDFKTLEHKETLKLLILRATEISLMKKKYFIDEKREREAYKYIIASQYISGLSTTLYETYGGITISSHIFPQESQCEIALRVDPKYNLIPRATISDELSSRRSTLKNYARTKDAIWLFDGGFSVYDVCPLSPDKCPARINPNIPCKLKHPVSYPSYCRMYQINFKEKVKHNQIILDSLGGCDSISHLIHDDPVVDIKFHPTEKTPWSYPPIRLRRVFHTKQIADLGQLIGLSPKKIEREQGYIGRLLALKPYDRYHQADLQALKNIEFGPKTLSFSPVYKELVILT